MIILIHWPRTPGSGWNQSRLYGSKVSSFESDKYAAARSHETIALQMTALAFLISTQLIHYLTILPQGRAELGHEAQSCDCKIIDR